MAVTVLLRQLSLCKSSSLEGKITPLLAMLDSLA